MDSKLQELTNKLYQDGLSKGKAEGEQILAAAKEEAAQILREANEKAEAIVKAAEDTAKDRAVKVEAEIRLAASQALSATKNAISELVVTKIAKEPAKAALTSAEFVKEVVKAVAANYGAEDVEVVLPEALKAELTPFVNTELGKIFKGGVEASFSRKLAGGFKIGPKDGGYYLSFTDEAFAELISSYIRPATKELIFG